MEQIITLANFEQYLAGAPLERGRDYFKKGAVTDLSEDEPGIWTATVEGSDEYQVEITLEYEAIEETACNCPHEVDYCKHVIAVLYELKGLKAPQKESYERLIHRMLDKSTEGRVALDYQSAASFAKEIKQLLAQARTAMDVHHYAITADIAFAVINKVDKIVGGHDPSGGDLNECVNQGFVLLKQIAAATISGELREHIFTDTLAAAADPAYEPFEYDLSWLDTVVAIVDSPEKEVRAIALIDKKIAGAANRTNLIREYITGNLLPRKIALLRKMGHAREALELTREHLYLQRIRLAYIEELIVQKDYAEAKRLSEEGFRKYPMSGIIYKELFLRIAGGENDLTAYRAIAMELYRTMAFGYEEYYKLYKASFLPEEWPGGVGKFIGYMESNAPGENTDLQRYYKRLGVILLAEKYWDRLLAMVRAAGDLIVANRFIPYTLPTHPAESIEVFKDALITFAKLKPGKNPYDIIRDALIDLKEWPGGLPVARDLVVQFKAQYKNRPALLQELARVGA